MFVLWLLYTHRDASFECPKGWDVATVQRGSVFVFYREIDLVSVLLWSALLCFAAAVLDNRGPLHASASRVRADDWQVYLARRFWSDSVHWAATESDRLLADFFARPALVANLTAAGVPAPVFAQQPAAQPKDEL